MKKPTHKIYRTTNWPAYNRALMSRGNIAIWFDPATQWYAPSKGKQGRNQTYSDAAIQCCLMIKSLFRLSLRTGLDAAGLILEFQFIDMGIADDLTKRMEKIEKNFQSGK